MGLGQYKSLGTYCGLHTASKVILEALVELLLGKGDIHIIICLNVKVNCF